MFELGREWGQGESELWEWVQRRERGRERGQGSKQGREWDEGELGLSSSTGRIGSQGGRGRSRNPGGSDGGSGD
ncbi:hypothetical protein PoB_005005600 [Plakobranchus ocellatus]|uniref:Uncharacterized protein n=1 Tax=Plakobranchus ocellatus TaxID=259542 RepID=A0AAV4BWR5_9GAST|nr:hypothetical protein PoB_005005600 [Plakobranchus ocellatus]